MDRDTICDFVFRSLRAHKELSPTKLADQLKNGVASYVEIWAMRRQLDNMVEDGYLVLSNEGRYRLSDRGKTLPLQGVRRPWQF